MKKKTIDLLEDYVNASNRLIEFLIQKRFELECEIKLLKDEKTDDECKCKNKECLHNQIE